jgi:hypothetical protein
MTRRKTMLVAAVSAATLLLASAPARVSAGTSSVLKSVLLPGLGQAQDGHYGRAAIFASAAVVSWTGFFATQINYSRSAEKYNNEKRIYLSYGEQLADGTVVRQEDIETTYAEMQSAFDQADTDQTRRNLFIGALAVTYAVNIVDILRSKPDTGEREPRMSVEWRGDGFRLVRTVRF